MKTGHARGDYGGALALYQKSLEIKERLGDLAGMSKSYGAAGFAQLQRGDRAEACAALQKSKACFEQMKLPVPDGLLQAIKLACE